ncbi:MAG TPA: hypothetical protein PKA64_00825 [Myxococcota bacterium]|nr:hypothetical protein [Myxococcota bacterium]
MRKGIVYKLPDQIQALSPDGVWQVVQEGVIEHLQSHLVPVDKDARLEPKAVCQLAIAQVLAAMVFRSVNPKDMAAGTAGPPKTFEVGAGGLHFDWPEPESTMPPSVQFTIREDEDGSEEDDFGLGGGTWLEDTADVFGKGTVLVLDGDYKGMFAVETVVSERFDRDAIKRAMRDHFKREPYDKRPGRRIVVRPYYSRVVRIELAERPFTEREDPEDVQSRERSLICRLEAECEIVRLQRREPIVRVIPPPSIDLA